MSKQYIRTGVKIRYRNVEGELWIRIRRKDDRIYYECYLYVGFNRKLVPVSCIDIESEYAIDVKKLVEKHLQDVNDDHSLALGKA